MPLRPFAPHLSSAAWAGIAFLLVLLSLSGDSIDMMESQTWDYARHETFAGFSQELKSDAAPESQMPLAMFSFWAWARAFGTGEFAMRSLNLVWIAIALAAFARVGRQLSIPWLPMLLAIQPFVWYHSNYARTPLMQIAGGSLLVLGTLGTLRRNPSSGAAGIYLCIGAILLSGANIFGVLPLVAIVVGLTAHGAWKRMQIPLFGKVAALATAAIVLCLTTYYFLTLLRGVGGSQLWSVSPANVVFAAYEFLGLQGIGPGRQELRNIMKGLASSRDLLPFLPGILVLSAAYGVLLAAAVRSWMTRECRHSEPGSVAPSGAGPEHSIALILPWFMGVGVPLFTAALLYILATATGVPFWGRHLSGAFPFWIVALGITIHWARQGLWRKKGRLASGIILVGLLASSLLIRFAPWHRHDDYRQAAAEALRISAGGGIVWWVADYSGGAYYGLPLAEKTTGARGEIQFSMNRLEPGFPDAIIVSRCDIFDSSGVVAGLIGSGAYRRTARLKAFDIWERW